MDASTAAAWWGAIVATIAVIFQILDGIHERPKLSITQEHWGSWSCGISIRASERSVVTAVRLVGYETIFHKLFRRPSVQPAWNFIQTTDGEGEIQLPVEIDRGESANFAIRFFNHEADTWIMSNKYKYVEIKEAFHRRPYRYEFRYTDDEEHLLK